MRAFRAPMQQPSLARWDPFYLFSDMRLQMDEFVTGVLDQQLVGAVGWRPTIEVEESEGSFTIRIEVPGWEEHDVVVKTDQNTMTIRGRHDESTTQVSGRKWQAHRGTGSFIQSLNLPSTIQVERITAQLEHGLLTVHLPKRL